MSFHPYGITIALAAAISLAWMALSEKKHGNTISLYAMLSIPLGFLFARLFRALVSQGWYLLHEDFLFNFSRGGYMLYGALTGCILAAFIAARLSGKACSFVLDTAAAPGMFMIFAARMAEGLTGSGYGRSIVEWFDPWMEESMIAWEDPSFLFRFPFGIPDYYEEWNWCIFFPEALTALIILIILLTRKPSRQGGRFSLMVLLYAGTQILFESMRQDAVPRWGFVRVDQLLSGIAVLMVLAFSCSVSGNMVTGKKKGMAWGASVLMLGIILTMEFALEKKIPFLVWMRMDVCYLVMGLACLSLILIVNTVRKPAFAFTAGKEDNP